jgi:hypothetical protein
MRDSIPAWVLSYFSVLSCVLYLLYDHSLTRTFSCDSLIWEFWSQLIGQNTTVYDSRNLRPGCIEFLTEDFSRSIKCKKKLDVSSFIYVSWPLCKIWYLSMHVPLCTRNIPGRVSHINQVVMHISLFLFIFIDERCILEMHQDSNKNK